MKTNKAPTPHKSQRVLIPSYNLGLKTKKTNQKKKAQVWEPCLFPQLFYLFIYFRVLDKAKLSLSRNTKKIVLLGEGLYLDLCLQAYVWSCIWICVWSLIFFPCLVVFDVRSLSWWLFMTLYFFCVFSYRLLDIVFAWKRLFFYQTIFQAFLCKR